MLTVRPIRLRAACRPPEHLAAAARAITAAFDGLDREFTVPTPDPPPLPPKPPRRSAAMAAKRARKTPPAAVPGALPTPDPALVKQVKADLLARLEADTAPPPGVTGAVVGDVGARSAALFGGKGGGKGAGGLKKLVDALVPALAKVAAIAGDGKVTPGELVELGVDVIKKLVGKKDAGAGTPPAPTPPTAA